MRLLVRRAAPRNADADRRRRWQTTLVEDRHSPGRASGATPGRSIYSDMSNRQPDAQRRRSCFATSVLRRRSDPSRYEPIGFSGSRNPARASSRYRQRRSPCLAFTKRVSVRDVSNPASSFDTLLGGSAPWSRSSSRFLMPMVFLRFSAPTSAPHRIRRSRRSPCPAVATRVTRRQLHRGSMASLVYFSRW